MSFFTLFPHDILYHIFSFDTRFVLRKNKWIFIDKIPKDDFRYFILQKRFIITLCFSETNMNRSCRVVRLHKNIFSIILYNMHFESDIEFSHYLYKTLRDYI